ncbi:NADPH:quinone reductase [Kineosporia sp. NBRC 101731]|uniref:NADPH:quinone reductase n=1 Tax=Kineosporia sp. NBRC 101731 TaxID=3032199 RepID=UPI00255549BE|nr:NADPH:quinone reductase [Kineosporia sp. NBRC 101731]
MIDTTGSADGIIYRETVNPVVIPGTVRVQVLASAVNNVDTFVRSGRFRTKLPMPFVVGRDLVGTVVEIGDGVSRFRHGQMVWSNSLGHDGRQGAAAEEALVPADRLYPAPPGVAPQDLVASVHPGVTSWLALHRWARIRSGETVLVHGGGGNVGAAAIVIARDAGATVISTSSAADLGYCRSLGASVALDYRDPDGAGYLMGTWAGRVDVVIDTSGQNDLPTSVALLARRGRIVLLAGAGALPVLPVGQLYMNDASVIGFVISHATVDELSDGAREISRLLAAGTLRPRSVELRPLSSAAQVHRSLEAGELGGRRVVLVPQTSPLIERLDGGRPLTT